MTGRKTQRFAVVAVLACVAVFGWIAQGWAYE
ncbi:MAG: hypothetical protein HW385_834, partial [candidate division NC10 bacterium]|nr:hypothetical protein [candidate division NC10 bacterium]